jgi:hypothetical protein
MVALYGDLPSRARLIHDTVLPGWGYRIDAPQNAGVPGQRQGGRDPPRLRLVGPAPRLAGRHRRDGPHGRAGLDRGPVLAKAEMLERNDG